MFEETEKWAKHVIPYEIYSILEIEKRCCTSLRVVDAKIESPIYDSMLNKTSWYDGGIICPDPNS